MAIDDARSIENLTQIDYAFYGKPSVEIFKISSSNTVNRGSEYFTLDSYELSSNNYLFERQAIQQSFQNFIYFH
jgi:hypothetical protein